MAVMKDWGYLRATKLVLVPFSGKSSHAYAQVFSEHPSDSDVLAFSAPFQKQILAHELFHIFQDTHYFDSALPPMSSWWVEGSADYFSNVVSPCLSKDDDSL
jgi:hypothetical protein